MANEVLIKHHKLQGTYEISNTVNGKSSWKQKTHQSEKHAIWYNSIRKSWVIGYNYDEDIGTMNALIYSKQRYTEYDCPQQVPKDTWKYYDKSWGWLNANSNDIIIECEGKNIRMNLFRYLRWDMFFNHGCFLYMNPQLFFNVVVFLL